MKDKVTLLKATLVGALAGLSVLLGNPARAIAASTVDAIAPFQRIEQPIHNKIFVALGGLGLIGLELWWFILDKPQGVRASVQGKIQEITIIVDGGYEPNQVIVRAGQPVRLNFNRQDPSSCLEEVRFPKFQIARKLPLNQVTTIEIAPDKVGQYEFTCGMNMFRGVLNVQ
jgi:plastocyanin domain-containing protein